MYLATRMPQISGLFAELWMTRLLDSPNTAKVLADVSTCSVATERLAAAAEMLPNQIAVERNATIRQAMKGIAQERNRAVNQIAAALSDERKATHYAQQFLPFIYRLEKRQLARYFFQRG